MKKRLFIGSSGEHLGICRMIKEAIDEACGEWLDVEIWKGSGVFELNRGTLEALVQASREFDYGVFVAAEDDTLRSRGRKKKVTRDNVLFEAGLFMGSLGLSRTYIMASSEVSLPSDFNGATVIMYGGDGPGKEEYDSIIEKLQETKNRYRVGHMFSTSLAYEYYQGFIKPIMHLLTREGVSCLSVYVPHKVSELRERIEKHKNETGAEEVEKGSWHIHHYHQENSNTYWDIPRCLANLEGLIGFSKHKAEFGKETDWNRWMKRELDNFCEVLQALLEDDGLYDEKVHIFRL